MKPEIFVTVVLIPLLAFLSGFFAAAAKHGGDWYAGWDAGYAAHQELARENDVRLKTAGLCVYANLACKRPK
jgi:hypothetical protein